MDWTAVRDEAEKYTKPLQELCPRYLDELRGIADGAGLDFVDVLALNVRTEINFGLFTVNQSAPIKMDGCTSLSYKSQETGESFLGQNWDWQLEQSPNIFVCHVSQPGTGLPQFSMVTEGGIIGKIGFNEDGVGVCLNAIRAVGVDQSKMPIHFALRKVLESPSRKAAIDMLRKHGVAGSAHMLIADPSGATGLECTYLGLREIQMDSRGTVSHSNHLVLEHPGINEPPWLADSPLRLSRAKQLLREKLSDSTDAAASLLDIFEDEDGYPAAINRRQIDGCGTETLFTILMNLTARKAVVSFGRRTAPTEQIELSF